MVVAKIEAGGRVAVAGIRPYEVISHGNDQPVFSVGAFRRLTFEGGELRRSVERLSRGRLVDIRISADPADGVQDISSP